MNELSQTDDSTLLIASAVLLGIIFIVALVAAGRSFFGRNKRNEFVNRRLQSDSATGAPTSSNASILGRDRLKAEEETTHQPVARLLTHAGFREAGALQYFIISKFVLGAALPIVFMVFRVHLDTPLGSVLPVAIVCGLVGFLAPNAWLHGRVRKRQQTLESGLPNAMDLLVTCESGLGLDAALQRVAEEITLATPLLAEEFKTTFMEVSAGIGRTAAFKRLADRTGVDDLRSLSATLSQAETFGTSIASALRGKAEWIRTRRMQLAETRAAVVSVKMTIPLVLCILPALMAVIMGPAIARIAANFLPYFGGN